MEGLKQETISPKRQFQQFLLQQISLPETERSDEFNKYVTEKALANKEVADQDETAEELKEKTFQRYLKGLDLTEEEMRSKKILDVGSGKEADFIQAVLSKGITGEAYGMDIEMDDTLVGKDPEHYFKTDFLNPPNVSNIDCVVSVGALSLDTNAEYIEDIFSRLAQLSSDTSELRIYPLRRAPEGSELMGVIESRKKWEAKLEEMKQKFGIEYEFRPIDIRVSGNNKDLWLDETLIIKKNS